MKKFLALLLAAIMVLSMMACGETPTEAPAGSSAAQTEATKTEPASTEPAPAKITEVVYYCSVGAYLKTLQEEVEKWNEGDGKAAGVNIRIESNINTYGDDLDALMKGGTHFELIDVGTSRQNWIEQGWVQDLEAIDDAELKAVIEGYKPYIVKGINIQGGMLFALPLEVVPIKMAVNLDLFKKNNLELPKTWEEMVNCAKVITENGNGKEFGYGWSTWASCYSRLTFKATMNSTGVGWWNPNTATYDFTPFKKQLEYVKEMYQKGYMLGADDLAIDPIRAQFAEGVVGMFPAPSYDYAVYTSQFPAKCEWTVIDMPAVDGEAKYKGVYLDRVGCSIDKVAYDAADATKKAAIVKAFNFLNSDYLNGKIYEMGGMIPYKAEVIKNAKVSDDLGPQWALFGDITNYTSMSLFPDKMIILEGDKFSTVFSDYVHDAITDLDAAIADVNARYNAGYQEAKAQGDTDLSIYEYKYDISK